MTEANKPKSSGKITITMEPMVQWFSPLELIQTGIRTLVAGVFGTYADRRDIQAALHLGRANPDQVDADYSQREELWIDYLADTGDGWNSTYSMAYLLAQPQLNLANTNPLPQADVVVFGGDQIYPTPANDGYTTRFVGPYRCAYPENTPSSHSRHIYAIPGNHDWYDGLSGFTRLFCSKNPIGAWQTQQTRSYFCLQLPHGWWMWGIDIQLGSDVDHEQFLYFASQAQKIQPGDRVILCTAEPCWIDESVRREDKNSLHRRERRFRNLSKIEELVPEHAELAATIAGDLHHYARYQPETQGPQRITCGGGGAYLLGTEELPDSLLFEEKQQRYDLVEESTYPSAKTSARLRWFTLLFPFKNKSFCLFLGMYYSLLAWVLQSNSAKAICLLSPFELLQQLVLHPSSMLLLLLAPIGMALFTSSAAPKTRFLGAVAGAFHGGLHLLLVCAVASFAHWLTPLFFDGLDVQHPLALLLLILPQLLLGGALGGLLLGLWLLFCSQKALSWHGEHVFSSQGNPHFKSFLRLHIHAEGLSIYAIGLNQTAKRWSSQFAVRAPRNDAWFKRICSKGQSFWDIPLAAMRQSIFQPEQGLKPHLIETITLRKPKNG